MPKNQASDREVIAKTDEAAALARAKPARFYGFVDGMVRDGALYLVAGGDEGGHGLKKMLEDEADALVKELAGPNPSAIERLLAERISTCSALTTAFENQYVWASKKCNATSAEFWGNQADKAHSRLLKAIAVLAQVRKVGHVVQVNIGERQVNVAGTVQASE